MSRSDPRFPLRALLLAPLLCACTWAQTLGVPPAPAPSATGTLRLDFGSCVQDARYGRVLVFEAMAREAPDVVLFVGDNSYFVVGDGGPQTWSTDGPSGDWSSSERMRARHLMTRTNQDLQALIRTVPSYATWDDHDYGPNNSDQSFQNRRQALRVFKQVWANPDYGAEDVSGVFSSFRWGPVEVFLMDDRYHKNV